jgi:hypothetical protein
MRRVFQLMSLLLAASALPAQAIVLPTGSATATASPTPSPSPGPSLGSYSETIVQSGTGWTLVQASGYDDNGAYFSSALYKIQNATGVNNAPIPDSLKADILASFSATDSAAITLPKSLVDDVVVSEQQGYLTPSLQAIAEPLDGGGVAVAAAPATARTSAATSGVSTLGLFGSCSDKVIVKSKSFNVSTPLSRNFTLGAGFTGNLSLTGNAQVTATGTINIAEHRFGIFGVCIPIGVKFNSARAYGNASMDLGTTLAGTVNYTNSWNWELAKPQLFTFDFSIGPVPVHVGFNLPITAGIDLNASATASITYTGAQTASGTFDYTCTLNGCSGSSSFTRVNPQPQPVTAGITGRIQPGVWAQVAVRAYLYTENFAYAQIGLRGDVYGDLWGYYGNNCGDADQDGLYETVNALTFDLDWQLQLNAQADTFITSTKKWVLKDFGRKHIQFWDLASSSALTPELRGLATQPSAPPPTFGGKMRSCWPYADNVNYSLAWGDGTSSAFSGAPQTVTNVSHTFTATGSKGLALTALSDVHGRTFSGKTTSRSINVASTPLDMTCYPVGSITGCSIAGYWASVSGLSFQYTSSSYSLQIVYPTSGTFPYSTNNSVIYFGLPNGSGGLGACPSGTQMGMSVWNGGSFLGTVYRSCP